MLVRHEGSLYKEAAKLTMYHGTASGKEDDLLRRILKHGLESDPRKRRYEAPETTTMSEEEVRSWEGLGMELNKKRNLEFVTYGGTYLASNLPTALGYAQGAVNDFGGEMVVVVARIETRSPEVTIDEDQFISTVNIRFNDFAEEYAKTLRQPDKFMEEHGLTPGTPHVRDAQFYDALVAGDYEISREDIETFLAKFLNDKPVNVSMQELMRYEQDLRNIFLLHAEFDAATDALNKDAAKRLRDPAEIAADFRDEVNAFTKRIGKVADPVGEENRNVRSFLPVGYKGANRIVGILVFDPEEQEGIVAYGAGNPETVRTAQQINNILEVNIHYTTSRDEGEVKLPRTEQSDFEEYVEIMMRWAIGEAEEKMSEWWYDNENPLQEVLNLENLQKDTGIPVETLTQVFVENNKEISEYIGSNFDPDSVEEGAWANRLDLYEKAQNEVRDILQCLTEAGLEEEANDTNFFREVVAPYTLSGYYDATNKYFEEDEEVDVDVVDKCLGYSGEGPLASAVYNLQEKMGFDHVYALVVEWFAEEYPELQEDTRAASVKKESTMSTKKQRRANPSWWGTADEDFYVDPNEHLPVNDILDAFDEMIGVQCSNGNWNFDPYMHGMANGMLYMKSLIDGQEPSFLEAPEVWLADLPDDGLPPTVADECYTDEQGNQMCEGPPHTEDASMALVPFEDAAQQDMLESDDDKVYFTTAASARPRGLDFIYPKADEPWRPPSHRQQKGKNLYLPDPRRESKRLPFKKERRTEKHPTIVETCGRNYILPECREEFEKGFNHMTAALRPFVRIAVVPHEELEEASWRVVDTQSDPLTDTEMYGTGRPEDIRERESFGGWEGESTLEVIIADIPYTIDLDWNVAPNAKGPKDVELRVWVKGGPEDLKLEMRDGSVMTAKEYFTTYVPQLIWDYDLNDELFPPGEPEYEDPRIPAM